MNIYKKAFFFSSFIYSFFPAQTCSQELAKKVKKLCISFALYCSIIPGFGFFQKAS